MAALSFVVRAVDEASAVLKGIGDEAEKLGGRFGKVGEVATKGFSMLGTAALGGTAAVVGIGAASVKAFSQFERGMNEVATLLPQFTDQQLGQLQRQVLDLSRDLGVMPSEVVPALYQALSAGVPADNVLSFLQTTFKAATAGGATLETAVNALTSVVNAYGAEVVDATKASDIMFTAVRLGKTDFKQLDASLFNVVPTAASLGVTFEEIGAAMAVMTARGVPTSVATTQLRQLLVEASKSGTKLSDAFAALAGQSFPDFIKSGGTVSEAMQMLREAVGDDAFRDLFGSVEAANAALLLTGPNAEAVRAAMEEMANATGATDAAFARMDRGISRAWQRIKASANVALLEVGAVLAPFVASALSAFADRLPGAMEQAREAFGRFREAAQPAVDVLVGQIIPAAVRLGETVRETLQPVLARVGDWFREHADQLRGPVAAAIGGVLVTAFAAVGVAAGGAALSIAAAVAPLLLVVGAVALVSAGVYLLVTRWDDLRSRFPILQEMQDLAERAFGAVARFVTDTLIPALRRIAEVAAEIVGAVRRNWGDIADVLSGPLNIARSLIVGQLEAIRVVIETQLRIIAGVVNVVMGILTGDWGRAWDGIKGIVSAVWDAITGLTRIAIETMRGVLGGLVDLLGDIGGRLMGVARSGIAAVWDEITRQVGVFVRGVKDSLESIVTTLLEMPGRAMSAAQALGGAIKDGLIAGIKGTIGAIGSLEEQLLSAIKAILNSAIDAINDAIPDKLSFSVAGKEFGIDLPNNPIPRLATGGIITRPGLAVVGEAGPELVLLPAQAAVLPNAIARAVAGAIGDRGPSVTVQILGPVTIGGEADLQRAVGDLGWGLAASLRARGVM